jgi:hypothetical protein
LPHGPHAALSTLNSGRANNRQRCKWKSLLRFFISGDGSNFPSHGFQPVHLTLAHYCCSFAYHMSAEWRITK